MKFKGNDFEKDVNNVLTLIKSLGNVGQSHYSLEFVFRNNNGEEMVVMDGVTLSELAQVDLSYDAKIKDRDYFLLNKKSAERIKTFISLDSKENEGNKQINDEKNEVEYDYEQVKLEDRAYITNTENFLENYPAELHGFDILALGFIKESEDIYYCRYRKGRISPSADKNYRIDLENKKESVNGEIVSIFYLKKMDVISKILTYLKNTKEYNPTQSINKNQYRFLMYMVADEKKFPNFLRLEEDEKENTEK